MGPKSVIAHNRSTQIFSEIYEIRVNVDFLMSHKFAKNYQRLPNITRENVTCFVERFEKLLNCSDVAENIKRHKKSKKYLKKVDNGEYQVLLNESGFFNLRCNQDRDEKYLLYEIPVSVLPQRMRTLMEQSIDQRNFIDEQKSK